MLFDGNAARKIVDFPTKTKKGNYKEGEKQEVYPFKKEEDLKRIHNYFVENKKFRDECMFIVGINVGLRAGDLLSLTWEQVVSESGEIADSVNIREEKTGKFRIFFLNNSAKAALEKFRKESTPEGYIFKSRKGGHIDVRPAGLILKKAAKAVGITYNVGTHSMRKTFGYWQLKSHNGDAMFLCELQEMFNHSSPKITLRYCGLETEKMEKYYNDVNLL